MSTMLLERLSPEVQRHRRWSGHRGSQKATCFVLEHGVSFWGELNCVQNKYMVPIVSINAGKPFIEAIKSAKFTVTMNPIFIARRLDWREEQ
jgi:hypothetical protein